MAAYSYRLPLILGPAPQRAFAGLKSSDRAARETILHRAYAIWESEGRPNDRQLAHWLRAEADVMRKQS
jgi:hypothetical protein